jgi:hypothetical protein
MEGEAMAKYKHYDYSQTLLLPVSLQDQLMPGTLEFAIHELVEHRMDMRSYWPMPAGSQDPGR